MSGVETYIMHVSTAGKNPFPSWSKEKLAKVCLKITNLFEQVETRERSAGEASQHLRERWLRRERDKFRSIRVSLYLILLDPDGANVTAANYWTMIRSLTLSGTSMRNDLSSTSSANWKQ